MNEPVPDEQPVAYDAEGRPLYYRPAEAARMDAVREDSGAGFANSSDPAEYPAEYPPEVFADTQSQNSPNLPEQTSRNSPNYPDSREQNSRNPQDYQNSQNPPNSQIDQNNQNNQNNSQNFSRNLPNNSNNPPNSPNIIRENLSPDEQADHDRSAHDYPELQLSPTEYVVIDVERSNWGYILIWLTAVAAFLVVIAVVILVEQTTSIANFSLLLIVGFATAFLCIVGGLVAAYVYRASYFILTNERVLQHIQAAPFSYRNQNIEIERVEDCSFHQSNIAQMLLDFGTIRLSTVGNEQTYIFTFAARPGEQFRVINNLVHQVEEKSSRRRE